MEYLADEMATKYPGKLPGPIHIFLMAIASFSCGAVSLPDEPSRLLGIAPQDKEYFAAELIACKDGSQFFRRDRLNDGFCDCPDGTDEPGTSACPEGRFYCRNTADKPTFIFSSRVNDHICDCCDGSDEYDGTTTCPDTCFKDEFLTKKSASHASEIQRKMVKSDDHSLRAKELWVALFLEMLIAICGITFCFIRSCNQSKRKHRRPRS